MAADTLTTTYAASQIWVIASDPEGCVCGPSPMIRDIIHDGRGAQLSTIILGLIDTLANFTAARYKFTEYQRTQLCNIIMTLHPTLKVRQLHHFFALAMGGIYGKFYDKLEPMDIMSALTQYVNVTCPAIWSKHYDKQHTY